MSEIRCIYRDAAPDFPASDQHPEAERHGPFSFDAGVVVFVDAIGGAPTLEEIHAVLNPPPAPEPTAMEKLNAAGLTVADLRFLLNLPD